MSVPDAFQVAARMQHIRSMLEKRITDTNEIIGAYVMTICFMIGSGDTNEQIVDSIAKLGRDIRLEHR